MSHEAKTTHQVQVLELVHSQHKALETIDRKVGQADLGRVGLMAVMGGRAYRDYAALSNRIGLSKAGNLRGMVISTRWRVLFEHTSHVGEYMENVGYLAALAAGIAESAPRLEAVARSADSATLKTMRVAATAGTIAQRALLGVVPAGAHLIYRSLEGWCMIAGLSGGRAKYAASQCVDTLHHADTLVRTTFKTVTDTSNQSEAVWSVINFMTSAKSK